MGVRMKDWSQLVKSQRAAVAKSLDQQPEKLKQQNSPLPHSQGRFLTSISTSASLPA